MYRFRILFLLATSLLVMLTTGCATVTRGTTESYVVNTNPAGAQVNSSSGWSCSSPCSVKVKRRGDFVLTITKPGYEQVTASVTSSIDGAGAAGMAGNVILGGLIGAGIDAGTGAMHSHKPNPLHVELQKTENAATSTTRASPVQARNYTARPSVTMASLAAPAPTQLSLDDFDCNEPKAPEAIPKRPDRNQILNAKRNIDRFQQENDVYQDCLLTLAHNSEAFGVKRDEVESAYDNAMTLEEALAEEFNTALDAYEGSRQ